MVPSGKVVVGAVPPPSAHVSLFTLLTHSGGWGSSTIAIADQLSYGINIGTFCRVLTIGTSWVVPFRGEELPVGPA